MRKTLITLIMLITVASPAFGGTAVATNSTNNSTTTAAPSTTVGETVSYDLTQTARITRWEVDENGTFRVTIKAELPTIIQISDTAAVVKSMSEGSGARSVKIPSRRYSLTPGTTTIRFDGMVFDDASAITVGSTGNAVLLRSDSMRTGGNPPVEWGTANALVGGAAIVSAAGTYRYVKRKREEQQMTAERTL
ncbi:hypothetical protein [Haloferax larsenii]|uniref:Uncharacterized protein n=1 Tax=Haloferax larsenii TaxID=302484 RepID=A0A1H7KJ87_HALLR|nr:hypothetical protein [Haloferax larsenii]SEK86832.1 hypothetical protein SAMN04488691_10222 [Haloferax larsenii]